MNSFIKKIRKIFFQGLAISAPVLIALYVIGIGFRLVYNVGNSVLVFLPDIYKSFFPKFVVQLITILVMAIGVMFVGYTSKTLIGKWLREIIQKVLFYIPGYKGLYTSIKHLLGMFVTKNDGNFSRVVLIEYPHKGKWAIGFLTSETTGKALPVANKEFYTIFMPSTPNPTTGFLMIVPKEDVVHTGMTTEEAFRFILSGGTIY